MSDPWGRPYKIVTRKLRARGPPATTEKEPTLLCRGHRDALPPARGHCAQKAAGFHPRDGMDHRVGSHRAPGGDQKNGLPPRSAGPGQDPGLDLERGNGCHGTQSSAPLHEMPEGRSLPTGVEDREAGLASQGRPTGDNAVVPTDMPAGKCRHAPRESCRRSTGATHVGTGAGLARQSVRIPEGTLDDRRGQARTGAHGRHGLSRWRGIDGVSGHHQSVQHHAMEQDSGGLGALRGSELPRPADPRLPR